MKAKSEVCKRWSLLIRSLEMFLFLTTVTCNVRPVKTGVIFGINNTSRFKPGWSHSLSF